ncbi:phosphoadenosine phosphosulfate reductase family protein [Sphingomonas abaci]|uniref:3'-phosphoadenosine 5'-phosphosulfate sulfotransferase (PAPS reductase)/FAD synthetase n=1 Tax=Sphingomonas abaci TaxID=237611 RepID=A0A7W7AJ52_9SPHN|nr:phosphoadenosine phosphosulfate reductase family protein [Sphingomonas abaci]MBB4617978.1 3'-phosphoadenosine 5'-phosphosulfate sulfotransferase (PAPS reductase)/FAD synthetase [Sphingomonas abaci]
MARRSAQERHQLGLFTTGFDDLALSPDVRAAIQAGAPVAFSLSGGKDSVSISHATAALLDRLGHPRDRRIAIHADLGRIEWASTPDTVNAHAARLAVPLIVVRNKSYDMLSKWERRFELGCIRYQDLLTYHLTAPWSSSANRFCTSEMKTQVILPELLRRFPGDRILSVVGIRREESFKRRLTPVSKAEAACWTRKTGAHILTWHPGVDVLEDEVYRYCARNSLPLPESYGLGSTRHGCAFCVLASENDINVAARAPGNRGVYLHLVDQEARTTFSFQQNRWLGDVAPDLLPASLAQDLARGQALATERRDLEASLPANLRYVKGWPQRVPSLGEATIIHAVRARILKMHRLETPFTTPVQVRERIAELHNAQRLKEAA